MRRGRHAGFIILACAAIASIYLFVLASYALSCCGPLWPALFALPAARAAAALLACRR